MLFRGASNHTKPRENHIYFHKVIPKCQNVFVFTFSFVLRDIHHATVMNDADYVVPPKIFICVQNHHGRKFEHTTHQNLLSLVIGGQETRTNWKFHA